MGLGRKLRWYGGSQTVPFGGHQQHSRRGVARRRLHNRTILTERFAARRMERPTPTDVSTRTMAVCANGKNDVNSNYNAFQFQAKKQISHGLLFNLNYTWSHSIDNGSGWQQFPRRAPMERVRVTDLQPTRRCRVSIVGTPSLTFEIDWSWNYVYQIPGPQHWLCWCRFGWMAI